MSDIASSSLEQPLCSQSHEVESPEPLSKKLKTTIKGSNAKLEHRLEDILCCVVCLDLPVCAVYQCNNGHLMCAGCFTHLLADARLRDEEAKCPSCRVEFSKQTASRNLAVEKALSELPLSCRFCGKEFPRNRIPDHEESACEERLTGCKYLKIGCLWKGPYHESMEHVQSCPYPYRTGSEVLETLQILQEKADHERSLLNQIFDLMSYEKIIFNDLQMRPYRTDEYLHKLFYETSRFSAFFNQWVVKARVNNNIKGDPSESSERTMMYQLCLKSNSKPTYPITVHFLAVRGPFGDMKVKPKIYKFEFTENENDSPYVELPLCDSSECNRLLAAKVINFRLIMFIVSR